MKFASVTMFAAAALFSGVVNAQRGAPVRTAPVTPRAPVKAAPATAPQALTGATAPISMHGGGVAAPARGDVNWSGGGLQSEGKGSITGKTEYGSVSSASSDIADSRTGLNAALNSFEMTVAEPGSVPEFVAYASETFPAQCGVACVNNVTDTVINATKIAEEEAVHDGDLAMAKALKAAGRSTQFAQACPAAPGAQSIVNQLKTLAL